VPRGTCWERCPAHEQSGGGTSARTPRIQGCQLPVTRAHWPGTTGRQGAGVKANNKGCQNPDGQADSLRLHMRRVRTQTPGSAGCGTRPGDSEHTGPRCPTDLVEPKEALHPEKHRHTQTRTRTDTERGLPGPPMPQPSLRQVCSHAGADTHTAQHCTAQHNTALHCTAQHSIAPHNAPRGPAHAVKHRRVRHAVPFELLLHTGLEGGQRVRYNGGQAL
jgi:hypothetical protein